MKEDNIKGGIAMRRMSCGKREDGIETESQKRREKAGSKGENESERRTAARRKSVYEASAIGWGNEI